METIEEILSGKATETAETPEKPETPVATEQGEQGAKPTGETEDAKGEQPRDEQGRFAPKPAETKPADKSKDAAPPAAEQKSETIPVKAQLEERRKRQEAERRAAEAERRLQEFQAKASPPQRPDVFQDPEAFRQDIETRIRAEMLNDRANWSEEMIRDTHADAEEAIAAYMPVLQGNPTLARQVLGSPHPYKLIYQQGKKLLAMQEIGDDPASFKQRVREEIRRELEAELATKQPEQPTTQNALTLPTSLATARNAGSRSGPAWSGPPTLNEILKR